MLLGTMCPIPHAPVLPAPRPEPRRLLGRTLNLEPLASAQAADLYACAPAGEADRIYRFLPEAPPPDLATVQAWVDARVGGADPMFYACRELDGGRVVGRQALMRITPDYGVIEIGNILWGPSMARTVLATEALYLTACYVFDELGYRRFEWKCDALNEPSRRAALRFGFEFEGVFRQHLWVKGRNRDTAWFAMLDRDWPRLRRGYEAWLAPGNHDAAGRQRATLAECIARL